MLFCMILLMKTMFPAVVITSAVLFSPMLKWMSSVMLLVLVENVRMTLLMHMVGLMLINCMYRGCLMSSCCNGPLQHLRPQMRPMMR